MYPSTLIFQLVDASIDPKIRVGGGIDQPINQGRWMHLPTLIFYSTLTTCFNIMFNWPVGTQYYCLCSSNSYYYYYYYSYYSKKKSRNLNLNSRYGTSRRSALLVVASFFKYPFIQNKSVNDISINQLLLTGPIGDLYRTDC